MNEPAASVPAVSSATADPGIAAGTVTLMVMTP